jgi:hypothetical protein
MAQAMDIEFKNWIMNYLESNPDIRKVLLRTLKLDPKGAQQMVHDSLRVWGEGYPHVVEIHLDRNPQEVLQAVREHFADELAGIIQ